MKLGFRSIKKIPKKNKYHAVKCLAEGMWFDSQAEAHRWLELRMLQRAGMITGLTRQTSFELVPGREVGGKKIRGIYYRADFVYYEDGKMVVEDVKGYKTKEYELKKKMMLLLRGIEIKEV